MWSLVHACEAVVVAVTLAQISIYIVSMCGWPTCEHLGFEICIISYLLKCRVHLKVLIYLLIYYSSPLVEAPDGMEIEHPAAKSKIILQQRLNITSVVLPPGRSAIYAE